MVVIGNAILIKKKVNEKELHYLKIREYSRDGNFEETELFCRLTNKVQQLVGEYLDNTNDLQIDIKDSFFTIDKYRKGEQVYTKPTLVLKDIEIL